MRILALEPYATLSHLRQLEGWARASAHEVRVETLPAHHWKWRMRTAALHFARAVDEGGPWDLLFASDYLNLAELYALLPPRARSLPAVVYFHENQLTYPLQPGERRDVHFALTHLYAILAARRAAFNSRFHRDGFVRALRELARGVPDVDLAGALDAVERRSCVLPLGTDVPAGAPRGAAEAGDAPTILWNHRWEYDKNPAGLARAVAELERRGVPFRLALLGQRFRTGPPELAALERELAHRIAYAGFAEGDAAYRERLAAADLVFSCAWHEFFGLGALEAIRAGALPVLPDDLAYPELVPPELHADFLYADRERAADALERALDAARTGAWREARARLVRSTDRFAWERLAPRYDALCEAAAGDPPG